MGKITKFFANSLSDGKKQVGKSLREEAKAYSPKGPKSMVTRAALNPVLTATAFGVGVTRRTRRKLGL